MGTEILQTVKIRAPRLPQVKQNETKQNKLLNNIAKVLPGNYLKLIEKILFRDFPVCFYGFSLYFSHPDLEPATAELQINTYMKIDCEQTAKSVDYDFPQLKLNKRIKILK